MSLEARLVEFVDRGCHYLEDIIPHKGLLMGPLRLERNGMALLRHVIRVVMQVNVAILGRKSTLNLIIKYFHCFLL